MLGTCYTDTFMYLHCSQPCTRELTFFGAVQHWQIPASFATEGRHVKHVTANVYFDKWQ